MKKLKRSLSIIIISLFFTSIAYGEDSPEKENLPTLLPPKNTSVSDTKPQKPLSPSQTKSKKGAKESSQEQRFFIPEEPRETDNTDELFKDNDQTEAEDTPTVKSENAPSEEVVKSQKIRGSRKSEMASHDWLKLYKPSPQVITEEAFQVAEISQKDITRIVCFASIERDIYSKEKGIEIKLVDKNAFIKNLPKESMDPISGRMSYEYDSRPKELYLVCGGKTFSLLLIPKDIPAQTIYLKPAYVDKEKATAYETSSHYEETIMTLIKDAYIENVPDGFDIEEINKPFKEFNELSLIHKKNYIGSRYQIQEFVIISKTNFNINEILLLETIKPKNPLAVSIISTALRPNEQTRAFIVRLLKDE